MNVPDVSPDLPSRPWRLILALLRRAPQGALSRSFGRLADVELPAALRGPVLGAFARAVGIDLTEAELPLEAYPTLNAFFVRRLRAGLRASPPPDGFGSPVDGVVGQVGGITDGRAVQAKGRWYSVGELLGDERAAARYRGGSFVTLYLSPRHYHRIHAPCGGEIHAARYIPGSLLPVNAAAVAHVPELFARNERLVCHLDSAHGPTAVVAVGAYNVGRISAAFDLEWGGPLGPVARIASWASNRGGSQAEEHRYAPPLAVRAGDEIMAFHLGSTIVELFAADAPPLRPELRPGRAISLGEPLTLRAAESIRRTRS